MPLSEANFAVKSFRTHPYCGGLACTGALVENETCSGTDPVDCVWNSWGEWSQCSGSCGMSGTKTRTQTIR